MTIPDPTAEIKAIRHKLGADFNYDLQRIFADIQRRQSESGHSYVTMPPRPVAENSAKPDNGETERAAIGHSPTPASDRS